jgi:hypothetical protein
MANIHYEIETLVTDDNRLNEIPVKVIIKNLSDATIKVLTIVPNIPNNVVLEEKADSFETGFKKEFEDLCIELSFILDNLIVSTSIEYRNNLVLTLKNIYKEVFSAFPLIYKLILFDRLQFNALMNNFNKKLSKLNYKINSIEDARWAYDRWIKDLQNNNPEKNMYEAKLQQLENLSSKIGKINSNYISLIEPKSFYSRTYVLHFNRKTLSTKIYNISFDSTYSDDSREFRADVSTSINITPKALSLTIFAAFSSVLGTILKYCMSNLNNQFDPKSFFIELTKNIVIPGITSIIISVLFFNVFEFTEMGKKLKTGVNWRTALTIGILAGMFGDRLIDAIKVFIGLN